MPNSLPTFERPPVVETLLGMQFDPIPKLTTAHLGLFWKSLGAHWVSLAETNPIGQTSGFISVGPSWMTPDGPVIGLGPVRLPSMRLRMVNAAGDRSLQAENGWLVYNWRQQPGALTYPRFDTIKGEFERNRAAFAKFCADSGFSNPKPNLWEVSYVNLVPKGDLWTTPDDWPTLLPGLLGTVKSKALDGLLTGEGHWTFSIGSGRGELQVHLEHAATGEAAEQEMLLLRLIARGRIQDGSVAELEAGYELGHEAIVTTFRDIAGEPALKFWRLNS